MKLVKPIIAVLIVGALIGGCGRAESYGEALSKRGASAIGDILVDPKAYEGKTVTVKGTISEECHTGCWFNVKEGGARIYVDINPSGFAIPQKVGHAVTVEGEVVLEDGRPMIVGKGVEIR